MNKKEKSKAKIWMPFYVGDYLADTMHLTAAEHGGYLMLMLHYWKSGPIPDDDVRLATITRLGDAWSNASSTIRAFFEHRDGMLVHDRIDREKIEACSNSDKNQARAKAAADKRWAKNAPSNATSTPQAVLNECPSPSPTPSSNEDIKNIGAVAPDNTIERRQGTLEAIEAELDRQVPAKPAPVVLPNWMPMDAWNGYLAMRKKIKKVPTERAIELLIAKLSRMREVGHDVASVLDASTLANWTDVYEPKANAQRPGDQKFHPNGSDYSSSNEAQRRSMERHGVKVDMNEDINF